MEIRDDEKPPDPTKKRYYLYNRYILTNYIRIVDKDEVNEKLTS